jgi:hypothetical protein
MVAGLIVCGPMLQSMGLEVSVHKGEWSTPVVELTSNAS